MKTNKGQGVISELFYGLPDRICTHPRLQFLFFIYTCRKLKKELWSGLLQRVLLASHGRSSVKAGMVSSVGDYSVYQVSLPAIAHVVHNYIFISRLPRATCPVNDEADPIKIIVR